MYHCYLFFNNLKVQNYNYCSPIWYLKGYHFVAFYSTLYYSEYLDIFRNINIDIFLHRNLSIWFINILHEFHILLNENFKENYNYSYNYCSPSYMPNVTMLQRVILYSAFLHYSKFSYYSAFLHYSTFLQIFRNHNIDMFLQRNLSIQLINILHKFYILIYETSTQINVILNL